jgi:serine protease Do
MQKNFFRIYALTLSALSLGTSVLAQDSTAINGGGKKRDVEEIIIKGSGAQDSKMTIELKNGQWFINGKPADEFNDQNVIIERRGDDDFDEWVAPHSPFRGGIKDFNPEEFMISYSPNRAQLGVSSRRAADGGAQIENLSSGSAAEKMGLQKGDIITAVDQTKISDPEDLSRSIGGHKPDDKVVITYTRAGKVLKGTAVLGRFNDIKMNSSYFKMPKIEKDFNFQGPDRYFFRSDGPGPRIGLKAQDTEDGKGVKVLEVDEDSPAEKAGIKEGDLITNFDGKEVNSADSLAELARADRTKVSIKVKLTREGKPQEIEIKIPRNLKTASL